eukprot:g5668.t1
MKRKASDHEGSEVLFSKRARKRSSRMAEFVKSAGVENGRVTISDNSSKVAKSNNEQKNDGVQTIISNKGKGKSTSKTTTGKSSSKTSTTSGRHANKKKIPRSSNLMHQSYLRRNSWQTSEVVRRCIAALQTCGPLSAVQLAFVTGAPQTQIQVVLDVLVTTPLVSEVLVGTKEQAIAHARALIGRKMESRNRVLSEEKVSAKNEVESVAESTEYKKDNQSTEDQVGETKSGSSSSSGDTLEKKTSEDGKTDSGSHLSKVKKSAGNIEGTTTKNDVYPITSTNGMEVTYVYRDGEPLVGPVNLAEIHNEIRHEQAQLARCAQRVHALQAELALPISKRDPSTLILGILESDHTVVNSPLYKMLSRKLGIKNK